MVLTACNRNDFPLEATAIEVSFEMAGTSLGTVQSSQPFTLQTRDSTKFTVPIAFKGERPDQGSSAYVLTGYTTLQTPIGPRRVELFQRGAVALKPRDEVAHIPDAGRPCRPGKSTLPGYMPPRVVIPDAPSPIPQPMPGGQPQQ
jgi:Late embryogenesis abundant protein